MLSFFGRAPFALLGAIALLNLVSDLVVLHQKVELWLQAWEAFTRPIWDFLFGWAFEVLEVPFPPWLKDYFTVGLISAGMYLRARLWIVSNRLELTTVGNKNIALYTFRKRAAVEYFLLWPLSIPAFVFFNSVGVGGPDDVFSLEGHRGFTEVFLETAVYFLVALGASYGLASV